jgi:gliding motility-associated-like protein
VTQTDANGCESAATTVTVTVNPLPAAPTAAAVTICSGATATLTATGTGTLNWFSDAAGSTMVGTGASFTTPALTQNTTYYVQDMNATTGCMSALTAVTVTVNPLPNTPNAGTPVMVCLGDDVILTAAGSGTGDLVFFNSTGTEVGRVTMGGNPTATFNAGALAAGNYNFSVREDDGTCLSDVAAISVTVNALPTAPTATGTTICAGNSATLTTTATGTANWYSDAALTNLIATGSVYMTGNLATTTDFFVTQVDGNNCESAATTVTVTVNPNPVAPTSTPDTVCAGQTATLTATSAGGTINWYSDASVTIQVGTGASFTTTALAQTTTYYAQEVSVDGCLSPIVAVTAVVNAVANTPSTTAVTVCDGQDVILSATGSGTGDLVFYDNASVEIGRVTMAGNPNATLNIGSLAAGNYVYYAAEDNGTCPSGLVAIGVTVNTLPAAPAVADVSICSGTTASLSAASSVNWYSDAALTNLVLISSNFTTGVLTTTTDYYVVTTDANGCSSISDTVTVTVDPLPATPTTMSDTTCEGNAATLMATGSGGTLNWYSDATGTTMIATGGTLNLSIVNQTTTYYVNETDATTGCVSTMGMATVVVNPNPNSPSASSIVICSGSDVILTATGSGTGDLVFYDNTSTEIGRFTMSVANATGTLNLGSLAVGNYVYFVAEDAGDCVSTLTSINVEVRQLPAAPTAFNDSPVCEGESVFVQANTIVGGNYSWTGPNGFSTTLQNFSLNNVTTAQAGIYNVAVTLNGCTSTSTPTNVTINARPVLSPLVSNSPLCELDDLSITTTAVAGATYAWTGPTGFATTTQDVNIPNVLEADHQGFYTLVATDANGCASLPLSTLVMITDLPDAGLASNNGPVCIGEELKLNVQDVFGATYAWSGPNGYTSTSRTPILNVVAADTGTYTVVVTVNNCSSTYTTEVEISPTPTIVAMPDTTITIGTLLELSVTGGVTYLWSPATYLNNPTIPNPIFTAPGIGAYTYLVTGYNVFGCAGVSQKVEITVDPPAIEDIRIVDLFTPNGDGVNDYWPVDFLQDPAIGPYTLQIITRGGMEVLNTQNYQNDWYGTYNGKNLPDGTYWYIIRLENDESIIKGAVTIKR